MRKLLSGIGLFAALTITLSAPLAIAAPDADILAARPAKAERKAKAEIVNAKGEKIGMAVLTELHEGVKIKIEARGLPPGLHGFHIHNKGTCTPPDFASAGEHLNPEGKQHGFSNPHGWHAGDLPNLTVGADGSVVAEMIDKRVTLAPDKPNSLFKPEGTALVIHAAPDDYATDPTGNSGARIACGVIR